MGLFSIFKKEDILETLSYEEQIEIFKSLGYQLNPGVTKQMICDQMKGNYVPGTDLETEFKKSPFQLLYYYLGWYHSYPPQYFTNNCVWYDLEFIESAEDYAAFMKRMGTISRGELVFSDINTSVDDNGNDWIDFTVNGVSKKWKLGQEGTIDDSFFSRFSLLTNELKTKGRYTYFDDGGQQFVIDYATDEQQRNFISKTGLKREWLGEGNHFSQPKE